MHACALVARQARPQEAAERVPAFHAENPLHGRSALSLGPVAFGASLLKPNDHATVR